MKERPILFSAPMVRAILDSQKTATRRICKHRRDWLTGCELACCELAGEVNRGCYDNAAYGQPGDRLWVREAHSLFQTHGQHRPDGKRWGPWGGLPTRTSPDGTQIAYYREGFDRCDGGPWRPSIHMPRWASRITLEITGVRVERLHDITAPDILAEGIRIPADPVSGNALIDISTRHGPSHFLTREQYSDPNAVLRAHWAALWVQINGIDSWTANPWVWVIEFKRLPQEPTHAQ